MSSQMFSEAFKNWKSRRLNNLGDDILNRGDLSKAEETFRASIAADGKASPLAMSNLGMLLLSTHRYDEGFVLLTRAAQLRPEHAGILINLGNAYFRLGRISKCIEMYSEALKIEPRNQYAISNLIRPKMDICDWKGIEALLNRVKALTESGTPIGQYITAFNSLLLPFTRGEQLSVAKYTAKRYEKFYDQVFQKKTPNGFLKKRIRIGYLSSDFHDHPTAHLTAAIYENHDRNKFEVFCYSIGYNDDSAFRKRIVAGCDHFVDVHVQGPREIARRIYNDAVDILIDLKGYTGDSRPEILAMRPAPIQVNYLGYPGTMGAKFIDYLIADTVIIPPHHAIDYSETIVRLPNTYQPTDDSQQIVEERPTRTAFNLPEGGFVYCSFNTAAKIDGRTFANWLTVLKAVPEAVLWLLDAPDETKANLALAAVKYGVDSSRLVYGAILPRARHLSRLRLADLALDTFVCNGHTTTTDALWAGVPVLTLIGETFAGRVAGSLLTAAGLPSMIMQNEAAYVQTAIALARDPSRLREIRNELAEKKGAALFNTTRFVSDLDVCYMQMCECALSSKGSSQGA